MSSSPGRIDHCGAGVHIGADIEAVRRIRSHVARTHTPARLRAELASAMAPWPEFRVWELGRVEAGTSGVRFMGGAA